MANWSTKPVFGWVFAPLNSRVKLPTLVQHDPLTALSILAAPIKPGEPYVVAKSAKVLLLACMGPGELKGERWWWYPEQHLVFENDATKLLHEFACWCAELLEETTTDPRAKAAIQAKRDWLVGKISDTTLGDKRTPALQTPSKVAWYAVNIAAPWAAWTTSGVVVDQQPEDCRVDEREYHTLELEQRLMAAFHPKRESQPTHPRRF